MAIKAIINNTEKEIEQIKNSDGQDIDYVYSRVGEKEAEGTPTVSIESVGGELTNYRIYGNTINGESVGDLVISGEHAGEYKVPVTVEGKNLLQNTATSQAKGRDESDPETYPGVTFTVNDDKSVTCNGVSNQAAYIYLCMDFIPEEGITYLYSGCPQNGGIISYELDLINPSGIIKQDIGNGITFDSTSRDGYLRVRLRIGAGYTCNNLTFYPMIRKADIEDDTYEPCRTPVITPIYLPEQIRKVGDDAEYIDYVEQKQHRVRKNLWSGVVEQGNVSQDGVYGSDNKRIRSKNVPIEPGTYMISSNVLIRIIYAYNDDQKIGVCLNSAEGVYSRSFTVPAGANNIAISMMKRVAGAQVDITPSDFIWGQIEKGSEATTYEPYIENVDLDVTLPALSTIKGTNTISVNTSIQPSNIYIKDNFDYKRVFTAIRAIEGIPPLTYKAVEGALNNYRIYGNTVDGESVGDRTANLFDENDVVTNIFITSDGTMAVGDNGDKFIYNRINVLPNITYTFSWQQMILGTANNTPYIRVSSYDANNNFLARDLMQVDVYPNKTCSITTRNNAAFWDIRIDDASSERGQHLEEVMLNAGSDALPYEPYGYKVPVTVSNGTDTLTTPIYLPEQIRKVGDEAKYIDYGEQKTHVDADEEIEKQATTYMVSITPKTDVSKIVFVTMSSVPDDCTILTSGIIFTRDEADANTLNSTNYADGVRGKAATVHNLRYTWTKTYIEGETYYVRSYVKYQTADNKIKEAYGDVYKADINGFERMRKNLLHVTLPALPTLPGTNVLSVGTAVQPSKVYIKGKIKEIN